MSLSRSAVTTAATIQWASGTPFNGWLLLIASPPTISGIAFNSVSLRDSAPKMRVPVRLRIPIREGVLDQYCKIFQTVSLVPTNVVYSAWWYDDNEVLLAVGASLFTVTTDPYTIAVPTLTDPIAAIAAPTPDSVPNTLINTLTYGAPTEETPSGAVNSVNLVYTISRAGSLVFIVRNGAVLTPTVDFNQSGTTITFTGGNAPLTGDILKAIIF